MVQVSSLEEKDALLDAWVECRREIDRMEARAAELLAAREVLFDADVAEHQLARESIRRSMIAEFSATGRLARGTMESAFATARALTDHPAVLDALQEGRITVAHARQITRVAAAIDEAVVNGTVDPAVTVLFDTAVLAFAEQDSPARTGAHARQVVTALLGETMRERHQRTRSERCVQIVSIEDGLARLTAVLPEHLAFAIRDRLDQLVREVVRAEKAEQAERAQIEREEHERAARERAEHERAQTERERAEHERAQTERERAARERAEAEDAMAGTAADAGDAEGHVVGADQAAGEDADDAETAGEAAFADEDPQGGMWAGRMPDDPDSVEEFLTRIEAYLAAGDDHLNDNHQYDDGPFEGATGRPFFGHPDDEWFPSDAEPAADFDARMDAFLADLNRTDDRNRTRAGERTLDQIRADLFTDLLLGSDPTALSGTGLDGITARIQVTVAATTLAGADNQMAQIDGIGPVHPDIARELAGRSSGWARLFLDPTGMVTETDAYSPTDGMRRFLRARDQHCRFPGCRRTVASCELDHNHDYALGGPTAIGNLAHFCPAHHQLKHPSVPDQFRWTARIDPDGGLVWTAPNGRHYTDTAPRRIMFV
ncbi:DUF222 domain-containing protein [Microbacterium sp. KUDC0406]|uniref:HNH endonuclease signature motif containing protein n=1 Tax=Microbacterium sp. KUDC0406 TaxID=2909588 RepID=UPI001F39EB3B|nr:HNH endonuclease signature motif containing protein [Microbacterium sp. KUDC0406]UJP10341.1 DUF222 domain-containing protein [Microbacterium sp. KUDC0406]